MKRYQITVDGHVFEVRLLSDPRQDRVEVEVDGQPLVVDVRDLDTAGGAAELSDFAPAAGAPTRAVADGSGDSRDLTTPRGPSRQMVAAPLPGVVKSVAVRPGQRVGPGDTLLVIEAMKMDNVIRASREGVVDAVRVAEGHRVAHGDVMIEYRG